MEEQQNLSELKPIEEVLQDKSFEIPTHYETHKVTLEEALQQKPKGDHPDIDVDFHTIKLDSLLSRLKTSVNGLSINEATQRLESGGLNVISSKKPNVYLKILVYLFSGFGFLLWPAAVLCFLAYIPFGDPPDLTNLGLSVLLIIVALTSSGFNAYQEFSSNKIMKTIAKMLPTSAIVVRDANEMEISLVNIVPGDIVKVI